jgi:glycosyltransferase involved in cell wall biosynthesis
MGELVDVCVVMHDLRGGGAERVTIRLIEGMVAAGKSVELVLFGDRADYAAPLGATIVRLGAKRVASGVPALARYLRDRRPRSVLTVMTHVNLATIAAARLANFKGRLLVMEHNQMSQKIAASNLAGRATYWAARFAYRFVDLVGVVSQGVADDLSKISHLPAAKIIVLHNPVVDGALKAQMAQALDHPWFGEGQPPVLVAVGRLHPQKDFANLLEAFVRIRAATAAKLLILGEGAERALLERMIIDLNLQDDVELPGFVNNPYAYISRAGAFVLSSRWEGLPTVLIEALACGAPVVSTNCPSGPSEILEDGKFGRLVPVGDPEALAAATLATLAAPIGRETSYARAEEFSVERTTARYLSALQV